MRALRRLTPLGLVLTLAACGGRIVPPSGEHPPVRERPRSERSAPRYQQRYDREPEATVRIVPATPLLAQPVETVPGATSAAAAGVVPGPALATLPIDEAQAAAALSAFASSCPALTKRTDASGLTRTTDWQGACDTARGGVRPGEAGAFLNRWFETAQVGDGRAFATGYYEPEIAGSRERRDGYEVPIHARPDDLIDVDLGQFSDALKGKKVRGRVEGQRLVPYYDRAAIDRGAIDGHARIIAWAADPVELFFLQVQGSGRLRLPDGTVMRIGYDTQNGRDYTGIGALMKTRGLLAPGQASMQGIVAWLHAHPDEGAAIMRENKSYVFFREITTAPLGALGYPVAGRVSAATDPRFVPLGTPVFLSMDRRDATGLWIAQDTGGAIKGANRFDTFWGAGAFARATAGGMSAHGTAFLLLPKGTIARLRRGSGNGIEGGNVGGGDGGTFTLP